MALAWQSINTRWEANGDSRAAAQSFQISLASLRRANRTQSLEAIGILKDYASLLRRMGRGSEERKVEGRANKESKQLMKDNPSGTRSMSAP